MAEITLVSWRDIPAQIIVGKGRKAQRHALPERFEQAIDRAAMKAGLAGTDDYLAQWHKHPISDLSAEAAVARIEQDYDQARLKALIDTGGTA